MKRTIIAALLILTFDTGCSPKKDEWKETVSKNTPDVYRSYIFKHPDSEERHAAEIRLEYLIYQKIKNSNEIASLSAFLKEYPKSKFKKQISRRIAELRAEKALKSNEIWPYIRFLHIHSDSELTRKIKNKLKILWWEKIKNSKNENDFKRFISFFRSGKFYQKAKLVLAEIQYLKLKKDPDPQKLKIFIAAFADTPYGLKARNDFIKIRNDEILMREEFTAVKKVILTKQHSLKAEKYALQRFMHNAVFSMNTNRMQELCKLDKNKFICTDSLLKTIKRWKKYSPSKRKQLLSVIKKADTWKPAVSVKGLNFALNSLDPRIIWIATDSLAYIDNPEAFFILLSKAGLPDPILSWTAENALKLWWKRKPAGAKALVEFAISKMKSMISDPSYAIRITILEKLTNKKYSLKSGLFKNIPREYKLVFTTAMYEYGFLSGHLSLLKIFEKTVNRLKSVFPENLSKQTYIAALDATRRLFILKWKLDNLVKKQNNLRLSILRENISSLYRLWKIKLNSMPSYIPLQYPVLEKPELWNKQRTKYLNKLRSRPGNEGIFWKEFLKNCN